MLRVDHDFDALKADNILLLPGRSTFQKCLNDMRMAVMATSRNPLARRHLRSRASIMFEKRRHFRNYKRMIHPFSIFSHVWTVIMIFILGLLLLLIPFYATFHVVHPACGWFVVKNTLISVCLLDVLLTCMTGYFDREEGIVVMEQAKILQHYIWYGSFLPDVLGSLPTDLIFLITWQEYTVARQIASLIALFRLWSLHVNIVRLSKAYGLSLVVYDMCSTIVWIVILLHWQACLCWLAPVALASLRQPESPGNYSWIHDKQLWNKSTSYQYEACLLRAVVTYLSTGFSYANLSSVEDLYIVTVMQVLGTITGWFLISRIMFFYKGATSSILGHRKAMARLTQYMRHKQLPHSTQSRILTYYEFRFHNRYYRESDILNTLSPQMRQEIGLVSCRKLVENVTFFNNLPIPLLGRIVSLLRSQIVLPNDVIVQADTLGDCMYFIATGTVAIYTSLGTEVCHLYDGAHFGEIALVMANERRVANVVAVEACELYRLDRADFERTIHPYPMLWERIKKIAYERHEKTMILNAE